MYVTNYVTDVENIMVKSNVVVVSKCESNFD
jgi:hypothetical protein